MNNTNYDTAEEVAERFHVEFINCKWIVFMEASSFNQAYSVVDWIKYILKYEGGHFEK